MAGPIVQGNAGWQVLRIANAEINRLERNEVNPFDHLLNRLPSDQAAQLRDDGTRRTVREAGGGVGDPTPPRWSWSSSRL